jgi:hypothetical protein
MLQNMPTETEHYIDDELLRDAERGIENERTPEFADDDEKDTEDEAEILGETGDPVLDDVLRYKGGEPEDWELTHRSSGEYMFNGSEMINAKTGESLTAQIESGYDAGYITAHHETLEMLKSGESLIMLPDYEDEDGVLHVTHLLLGPDNGITYEIRSTRVSERVDEEIFEVEEVTEEATTQNHIEFYEETVLTPEQRVETAPETFEHVHETTLDSLAADVGTEQQTEIVIEKTTEVSEIKEEVKETSWLSRFLRPESPALTPEENNSLESLPVFTENLDVGEARLAQQENMQRGESTINSEVRAYEYEIEVERKEHNVEQPTYHSESFVTAQIEHVPASTQQTVEIQREIFEAIVEQKQSVVEKIESPAVERSAEKVQHSVEETRLTVAKVEQEPSRANIESSKTQVLAFLRESNGKTAESSHESGQPLAKNTERAYGESFKDAPTSFENSKNERLAQSGNEILLHSLGIPFAPRLTNAREVTNLEKPRSTRYSPPQNDNASVPTTSRRTLHGIRMRRAA